MEITEVRVKLVGGPTERVKAFCTITLDGGFVIRDLKIIEGPNGVFLAMPSRKLADRCPKCAAKNHLRARFCNHCGNRLNEGRAPRDDQGRVKLHADVAHPINADCRDMIQTKVVEAFREEVERSGQPGYEPAMDIEAEFGGVEFDEFMEASRERQTPAAGHDGADVAHTHSHEADHRGGSPGPAPVGRQADARRNASDIIRESDSHTVGKPLKMPSTTVPARQEQAVSASDDDDGFAAGIV